jgi:hypothetical protein
MPQPVPRLQLRRLIGALLGAGIGYLLAHALPLVPSTLLSALVLAGATSLSALPQDAGRWWALIGAGTGSLVGTGTALAAALDQLDPAEQLPQRALMVLLLAITGVIAGRRLSRRQGWQPGRQPRDLLRSASALTTGVFAGIVTVAYIHSGLDVARTLSSRLSTSLTILVLSLVAPAWLSHLLHHHNRSVVDGGRGAEP